MRENGFALVEEELEVGVRSIAVPVRSASGAVVAALNVGAQASRVTAHQMKSAFLLVLMQGGP